MQTIWIGYDKREAKMYDCCVNALQRNMRRDKIDIFPLIQSDLRADSHYYRDVDHKASTEFSLTRFLVPYLAKYRGWALFMDCDILNTRDIAELFDKADNKYAVMVVKHDYVPKREVKMNGATQSVYPKKNWSSVMLFNCAHYATHNLTREYVNTASPSDLHQFKWCSESQIGRLPYEYNWLEGEYDKPCVIPMNIHYTNGHPLLDGDTSGSHIYEDLLLDEYNRLK